MLLLLHAAAGCACAPAGHGRSPPVGARPVIAFPLVSVWPRVWVSPIICGNPRQVSTAGVQRQRRSGRMGFEVVDGAAAERRKAGAKYEPGVGKILVAGDAFRQASLRLLEVRRDQAF